MSASSVSLMIGSSLKPLHAANLDKADKQKALEVLLRDIRNLLNAKPTYVIEEGFLKDFILNYGLVDLGNYSAYSEGDQVAVANIIATSLASFEPRLEDIDVEPLTSSDNYGVTLNFRITATVKFVDESIPVVLESEVNNITNRIYLRLSE